MSNLNMTIISGNIANDLELRYTGQGTAVADFTVAVDCGFGDKKETLWMECTAWSKTAESMTQHLGKGSRVNVRGRLAQDSWTDKETGKKRTKIKLIADQVEFLGGKRDGEARPPQQRQEPARQQYQAPPQQSQPAPQNFAGGDNEDDDIPF